MICLRRRKKVLKNIYKAFLENMPWPAWIVDTDSTILFINKSYEEIYNIKLKDIGGKSYQEVLPKYIADQYYRDLELCVQSKKICKSEQSVRERFFECTLFPIFDEQGKIEAVAGLIIDISEQKKKEKELEGRKEILRTIIDALPETIFYKDRDSRFIGYNKSFESYYRERNVQEIIGKTDLEIYDDKEVAKEFIAFDQEVIRSKEVKYFEQTITRKDGSVKIEENKKIPVLGADGEVWGVVGLSRDITEEKLLEAKLRYASEIDAMTGLYNRYSFEEKIKEYNKDRYLPLGIIMGDVNGLKLVNDALGHLEGDELLKNIARILKEACGERGNVFRWGGDEFVILMPNCNETMCEEMIKDILKACKNVERQFIQLSIALGKVVKYSVEDNIYDYIRKVEGKVYRQKLVDAKSMKGSILQTFKTSLEEKNMETNGHVHRVAFYAEAVGKVMNLRMAELDELILAAQLHDIGKIGISEELLLKPGKLTEEEFEILKTHSEKGYRIINAAGELSNVARYVLTHHERWDGSGYPLGLKKEEIPLASRIIGVVDAYDAMINEQVYKKAMSTEEAVKELERCAGKQFDPFIVEKFINYLRTT